MRMNQSVSLIVLSALVGAVLSSCDSVNLGSPSVFASTSPTVKGPPAPPEFVRRDVKQLLWQFPQLHKADEAAWVTWNNSGDPSMAGKTNWIDAVVKLSAVETSRLLTEYHPVPTDRQPTVQRILQSELPDGPYLSGPELNKHFSSPGVSAQAFLDRDRNVLVLTTTSGGR